MFKKWAPLAAVISALVLVTLACGFSASTATITSAVMSKDKDKVVSTTVFAPKDVIYCIVKQANAPDDTKVKAVWTAVQVEGSEANTKILEKEITTGLETVFFNISNDNAWPVGKYKVDIYLNDKLDKTVAFEVQ